MFSLHLHLPVSTRFSRFPPFSFRIHIIFILCHDSFPTKIKKNLFQIFCTRYTLELGCFVQQHIECNTRDIMNSVSTLIRISNQKLTQTITIYISNKPNQTKPNYTKPTLTGIIFWCCWWWTRQKINSTKNWLSDTVVHLITFASHPYHSRVISFVVVLFI